MTGPSRRAFAWASLAAALVAAVAFAPTFLAPVELLVKTSLGDPVQDPMGDDVAVGDGPVAFRVSRASLGFGTLSPGETSPPVRLDVTNEGLVPFTVSLSATALEGGATGARIPADRIAFGADASTRAGDLGEPAALPGVALAPGSTASVFLWLDVPSGGRQWIPEDDYLGGLLVQAEALR